MELFWNLPWSWDLEKFEEERESESFLTWAHPMFYNKRISELPKNFKNVVIHMIWIHMAADLLQLFLPGTFSEVLNLVDILEWKLKYE